MNTEPVGQPVLEGIALHKTFRPHAARDFFSMRGRENDGLKALDDASIRIGEGTTLAIVGESGSGKSTLVRALTMLAPPDQGRVLFRGEELTALGSGPLRRVLPRLQLLFQDSATSFNPRFSARDAVGEPLLIAGLARKNEFEERVRALLQDVGLDADAASRLVSTFSGGQKQRLALARALAAQPAVMVFDETFSGLDLSLREQMLELLTELRRKQRLTFILVTHDLELAARFAAKIAVMQRGKIVETGPAAQVMGAPAHVHTQQLLAGTNALRGAPSP